MVWMARAAVRHLPLCSGDSACWQVYAGILSQPVGFSPDWNSDCIYPSISFEYHPVEFENPVAGCFFVPGSCYFSPVDYCSALNYHSGSGFEHQGVDHTDGVACAVAKDLKDLKDWMEWMVYRSSCTSQGDQIAQLICAHFGQPLIATCDDRVRQSLLGFDHIVNSFFQCSNCD